MVHTIQMEFKNMIAAFRIYVGAIVGIDTVVALSKHMASIFDGRIIPSGSLSPYGIRAPYIYCN
jgi:hypothetical protein